METVELNFVILTKIMLFFWIVLETAFWTHFLRDSSFKKVERLNMQLVHQNFFELVVVLSAILSIITFLNFITFPFSDTKLIKYLSGWDTILLVITCIFRSATLFFVLGTKIERDVPLLKENN